MKLSKQEVEELDRKLANLYEVENYGKSFLSPNIRTQIIQAFQHILESVERGGKDG